MKTRLAMLVLAASVLAPQAVFSAETPTEKADTPKDERYYGAGTFDILVAAGLSSELYLHAEPALDVGIMNLGKTGAIGVGAGIDVGWCALCGLVSALSDLDWSGSYYAPFGRATLHAGKLSGLIPTVIDNHTLDLFLGVLAGPSFYKFSIGDNVGSSQIDFHRTTFRVSPLLGARVGFANNHVLLFGEYRYNIEVGFEQVTYTIDGTEQVIAPETISQRGNEFVLGAGVRF